MPTRVMIAAATVIQVWIRGRLRLGKAGASFSRMQMLLLLDEKASNQRRMCLREMIDCKQKLWRMQEADNDVQVFDGPMDESGTRGSSRQFKVEPPADARDQKWRKKFEKKQNDVLSMVQDLSEQVKMLQRQVTSNTTSMDRMADAIQSLQKVLVRNSGAGGVQGALSVSRPVPLSSTTPIPPSQNDMHGKSFVGELQDGPQVCTDTSDPGTPPLDRSIEEIGRGVRRDYSVEETVAAREARRRADEQQALIEAAVSGVQ
jgi:hypothetical protein